MKTEQEIEIDNKYRETKKEIDDNYNMISLNKKRFERYDELEESFGKIKDGMNKIAFYLNKSMKGTSINRFVQSIEETAQSTYRKATITADEGRERTKIELKKLYDRVDELEGDLRKIYSTEKEEKLKEEEVFEEKNINDR